MDVHPQSPGYSLLPAPWERSPHLDQDMNTNPDRYSYPRPRTWNLSLPENPLWAWCILALEYPSLIDPYMKKYCTNHSLSYPGAHRRIHADYPLHKHSGVWKIVRLPQNAGFSQIVTSTSRARVEYSGQPSAWASLPVGLLWSLFDLRLLPRSLVITYIGHIYT